MNNIQKNLIRRASEVHKIIGDWFPIMKTELSYTNIELRFERNIPSLNYNCLEPLVEYFIKNEINWEIQLDEINIFKLKIWK